MTTNGRHVIPLDEPSQIGCPGRFAELANRFNLSADVGQVPRAIYLGKRSKPRQNALKIARRGRKKNPPLKCPKSNHIVKKDHGVIPCGAWSTPRPRSRSVVPRFFPAHADPRGAHRHQSPWANCPCRSPPISRPSHQDNHMPAQRPITGNDLAE